MKTALFLLLISTASVAWKTYTDDINHYSFDYPENWEQGKDKETLYFLSPLEGKDDNFRENVNLILQSATDDVKTTEQYTALTQKQVVEKAGDKAVISLKNVTLAGQHTKEFIYTAKFNGRELKIKQYWFLKGKLFYLFTYTANPSSFDRFEGDATALIRSFRFL